MKRKIYIETSIISYLTARPSNDPIKSACQQITRLWWDAGRASVSAFISPLWKRPASAIGALINTVLLIIFRIWREEISLFAAWKENTILYVAAVVNLFRLLDRHPELIDEMP